MSHKLGKVNRTDVTNVVRGAKGVVTVWRSRVVRRSRSGGWSNDVTGNNGFSLVWKHGGGDLSPTTLQVDFVSLDGDRKVSGFAARHTNETRPRMVDSSKSGGAFSQEHALLFLRMSRQRVRKLASRHQEEFEVKLLSFKKSSIEDNFVGFLHWDATASVEVSNSCSPLLSS